MADINVAVINASTVLLDADVQAAIPALQMQVSHDFAPAWGIDADLSFVPSGAIPPADKWWLTILDDSDRGEDLGYHELNDDGLPLCKVFAKTDLAMGYQWTVTASHELLEMLADPNAHLTVFVSTVYGDFMYAQEVADPCEAEGYGYDIDGIRVSDFVLPAWFEPLRGIKGIPFDRCGHVMGPLQCLPGCHMDVYDVCLCTWRTFWGEGQPYRYEIRPASGTRRERRRRPRSRWRRSEVQRKREEASRAPQSVSELTTETLQDLSSSLGGLLDTIRRTRI